MIPAINQTSSISTQPQGEAPHWWQTAKKVALCVAVVVLVVSAAGVLAFLLTPAAGADAPGRRMERSSPDICIASPYITQRDLLRFENGSTCYELTPDEREIELDRLQIEADAMKWDERLSVRPPAPLRSFPIKQEQAQNWIQTYDTPDRQRVAQLFLDTTRHVSHLEFELALKDSIEQFNRWLDQQESKDYVLVVSRKGKSNRWVAELGLKYLKVLPRQVIQAADAGFLIRPDFITYMRNHPEIDKVVFMDDTTYSCSQSKRTVCEIASLNWIESCGMNGNQCSEETRQKLLKDEIPYTIAVIIPFMVDRNCVLMKSDVATTCIHKPNADERIRVFSTETISPLDQMWSEDDYKTFRDMEYGRKGRIPIYFDHKIADALSTFRDIYLFGEGSRYGRRRMHGVDTQFIDDIHPPYKPDDIHPPIWSLYWPQ